MEATLIGYLPKRTAKRPGAAEWVKVAAVEEICSVSNCISSAPDQRHEDMGQDRLTDFWLYPSAEAAERAIPDAGRAEFDVYAFRLLPVEFAEGGRRPFAILPAHVHAEDGSPVQPLDGSFERLGWDVANRGQVTSSSARHCPATTWPRRSPSIVTACSMMWRRRSGGRPSSTRRRTVAARVDLTMWSRCGGGSVNRTTPVAKPEVSAGPTPCARPSGRGVTVSRAAGPPPGLASDRTGLWFMPSTS